ncbi:unnamed protein product [Rhizoctonia solani]|uniref:Uncharacterized protein n=1 Tax=Rhizoctonia solani TaxID=456999 RepID=A0A8H3DI09_9AGAM|nr:unnamed protein product [Rhizoctonia solani]
MSHGLPPPYYTAVATLQPEHRDIASLIRKLSEDIVKTDQNFHDVRVLLQGKYAEVAPPNLKDDWRTLQQLYTNLIWSARKTATQVQTRNSEFINPILPIIGEPDVSNEEKVEELEGFIQRPPPKFLTSTESADTIKQINTGMTNLLKKYEERADQLVATAYANISRFEDEREKQKERAEADKEKEKKSSYSWFSSGPTEVSTPPAKIDYDAKIAEENSKIEGINKQRDEIKAKMADIRFSLNTIPDQVGHCFSTVWTHITNDATHLKSRLEGSTTSPMPDISTVVRVYTEINAALKYYATNVNSMGN